MACLIAARTATLMAAFCLGGNVLTLAFLKLGGGNIMVGLQGAILRFPFLFSILTIPEMERVGKRRLLLKWWTVSAVCTGLYLLVPHLAGRVDHTICLALLVAAMLTRNLTNSMGITGWMPLIQDVVPSRIRGRFFASLHMNWQLATLILLLIISAFLGDNAPWWKFQIVFLFGTLCYVFRTLILLPVRERRATQPPHTIEALGPRCRAFAKDPHLRAVMLFIITYSTAAHMTLPFKIKWMKELGYGDGYTVLAASVMLCLGGLVSLRNWGKLADRYGNRGLFSITHTGMMILLLIWPWVGYNSVSRFGILALYFCDGICFGGILVAQGRYILQLIPSDRQYQMSIMSVVLYTAPGIGPLIGGLLLLLTGSYQLLFVVSALLFLPAQWLRRRLPMHEDHATSVMISAMPQMVLEAFVPLFRSRKPK